MKLSLIFDTAVFRQLPNNNMTPGNHKGLPLQDSARRGNPRANSIVGILIFGSYLISCKTSGYRCNVTLCSACQDERYSISRLRKIQLILVPGSYTGYINFAPKGL